DDLAKALDGKMNQVVDAQMALDSANAQSLDQAAQTWAQVEGTAWAAYQAALIHDQAVEAANAALAQQTLSHALNDDALTAAKAHDADAAMAPETVAGEQYDDAIAQAELQLGVAAITAEATYTRAVNDAKAWQQQEDTAADADEQYAIAVASAKQNEIDQE